METITRKSDVIPLLQACIQAYQQQNLSACINAVKIHMLDQKIKFPLLEYCGSELHKTLEPQEHISFCTALQKFNTIGENVLTGIILQKRLDKYLSNSFTQATAYLEQAHVWYICDIIGERVFGYGLRHYPTEAFPQIERLSGHSSHWVRRGLGAGIHYAVKKGLDPGHTEKVFKALLTMANGKGKEVRQGVGWAAKTIAKFHPTLIEKYSTQINDSARVQNWFRRKVEIGLKRNQYAKGS